MAGSNLSSLSPAELEALFDCLAIKPPPGVISNLAPLNLNDLGYGVVIAAVCLCTILVLIRLNSRHPIKR
jgi:hypothetical protein